MTGDTEDLPTFGDLLKRYRVAAGLSQETLAERAGLTAQGIGALERGLRTTPQRETVRLLITALKLGRDDAARLEATIQRRHGPPGAPLPQRSALAANVPVSLTDLVGRERAVEAVTRLLQRDSVRLLTLTGPGGVGKTRLAVQVAAALGASFAEGAAFVDLAAVRDPALVPGAIARSVGLKEAGAASDLEQLRDTLAEKELLLVLDNFEQVVAGASSVRDLLAACPRLKVLATSRVALRLRGEQEFPVAPLDVPARGAPVSVEAVMRCPAVVLLVQRAQAAVPDFAVTEATAPAVAAICRRLDGLPLAIELAAARLRLLPPAVLAARLEQRLSLLTGGAQDLPSRQQTLRATFAWSYDLLDDQEQRVFRRLAVFAGGGALDAAEAVLDDPPPGDALETLASLVDKSLLRQVEQVDPATGTTRPRLHMLETVREFAGDCLAAAGEAAAAQQRHALYFLALAEEAAAHLRGPAQRAWREQLDQEHDNLRAALSWARAAGEIALGMRLAATLWYFWYTQGHLSEGRHWLEDLLGRAGDHAVPDETRAQVLLAAGTLAAQQGDFGRAQTLCAESERLCRGLREDWGTAWALNVRGVIARQQGDYDGARALYEESIAGFEEIPDRWGVALVLNNLGALCRYRGDAAQAAALYERSRALSAEVGDTWCTAMVLSNLGEIAHDQGDQARAVQLCEESLALFRALGDERGVAHTLTYLGGVAREQGDLARAIDLYRERVALCWQVGERTGLAAALEDLAGAVHGLGRPATAVRLCGGAAALRERIGAPLAPADRDNQAHLVAALRTELGPAFSAPWQDGQSRALDHLVNDALTLEVTVTTTEPPAAG